MPLCGSRGTPLLESSTTRRPIGLPHRVADLHTVVAPDVDVHDHRFGRLVDARAVRRVASTVQIAQLKLSRRAHLVGAHLPAPVIQRPGRPTHHGRIHRHPPERLRHALHGEVPRRYLNIPPVAGHRGLAPRHRDHTQRPAVLGRALFIDEGLGLAEPGVAGCGRQDRHTQRAPIGPAQLSRGGHLGRKVGLRLPGAVDHASSGSHWTDGRVSWKPRRQAASREAET